ncbi:hypothetical protein KQI89_05805 [Clostridium sp. MSJ-4]|uniref:PqqD family protein n=1 Tax=Clostridium simiarum TaxID=2841506 RepID=A0ABS6EYG6_9CLOT|nr:hypothetical protein [Clostridium simiarum]MBU5591271.1 hypothetical protein [Clostridium simiarum]
MVNIKSIDYPTRIAEKVDCFYLFNTKTFETISLDKISIQIFEKIIDKKSCTNEDLNQYAKINNVTKEDVEELINFLHANQFISIIEE